MEAVENSQNAFPTAPTGPGYVLEEKEKKTRRRIIARKVVHFPSGVLV
jgi:hypothetical protein